MHLRGKLQWDTKRLQWGRRDSSAVGSTDRFCRGPTFSSQHPDGCSELSIVSVPGNLGIQGRPSSGLCRHLPTYTQTHLVKIIIIVEMGLGRCSVVKSLLFQRTQVQVSVPTWQLTSFCNSGSRGSNARFWLPWAPTYMWCSHTCRQTLHT